MAASLTETISDYIFKLEERKAAQRDIRWNRLAEEYQAKFMRQKVEARHEINEYKAREFDFYEVLALAKEARMSFEWWFDIRVTYSEISPEFVFAVLLATFLAFFTSNFWWAAVLPGINLITAIVADIMCHIKIKRMAKYLAILDVLK